MEKLDIIVVTFIRVLVYIKAGNFDFRQLLELLIIDEVDLFFFFGYEDDVRGIFRYIYSLYFYV